MDKRVVTNRVLAASYGLRGLVQSLDHARKRRKFIGGETNMRRIFVFGSIICLALAGFILFQGNSNASGKTTALVTFSKDVAPIFYAKCANCHRAGEMAPMSLVNYKDVRPWAKSIREKVTSREMPPWYADPNHGQFVNDPRLTDQQIATIQAWVEGGAKEGDAKDLPPAPKFVDTGWKFGQPDVVLSMTEDYSVPADGTVPYKYYAVPTGFTEDKYVQFAEIKRGERSVVHHVIVSVREHDQGPTLPPGEIQVKAQRVTPEDTATT